MGPVLEQAVESKSPHYPTDETGVSNGQIIVLGDGVCGLATGIMLVRDGHEVTILERDEAPVPDSPEEAWEHWSRDGVTQFRQAHYLQCGGRAVLENALPDVVAALEAAGAIRFDPLCMMPPTITDRAPRPGDGRFVTITARRPALEQILAGAAQAEPGIDIRRGIGVKALKTRTYDRTLHVTGVRGDAGEELGADLVVDAMGRRSPLPRWLREAGSGAIHERPQTPASSTTHATSAHRTEQCHSLALRCSPRLAPFHW